MSLNVTCATADLRLALLDTLMEKASARINGCGDIYASPELMSAMKSKADEMAAAMFKHVSEQCDEYSEQLLDLLFGDRDSVVLHVRDMELAQAAGIDCGDLDNG
jgi:hypothetical protein